LLGVVFSLGLLTIFALLAVLIVVLRKFSWGEQFRYGAFIWVMVAILVIMALGMFGLFDVVLPDSIYNLTPSHESLVGNFLFGMLAAVLSTPCTAPMFAGLLAWALAAPATLGFLVVITIGIGMALPYLLLSAFPELAKRVPRTGPWSLVLKQMMGFFLLAVAVYFAGGRILSREDFFWSVFAVIAASMIFLVVRTIQLTPRWRPVLISIVVASGSTALALLLTLRLLGGLVWQPFTAETLAAARSSDKPVLVEFTANWCSNCIAIEVSVYHDPRTAREINRTGTVLLRADLTQSDAPGWQTLNKLNPGGGVPLTVLYAPGSDKPAVTLNSLYTTQNLLDALHRVATP